MLSAGPALKGEVLEKPHSLPARAEWFVSALQSANHIHTSRYNSLLHTIFHRAAIRTPHVSRSPILRIPPQIPYAPVRSA